jgi:Mrp family chromosome partitioning ATPase
VTPVPNLYVIPAGPLPPNPVELAVGTEAQQMLRELSERFPHVVLDAPPVLGIADALVLGNQVGSVLFVVARLAHARRMRKPRSSACGRRACCRLAR